MWEKSREREDFSRAWAAGCLWKRGSCRDRKRVKSVRSLGDWKEERDWNFSKRQKYIWEKAVFYSQITPCPS